MSVFPARRILNHWTTREVPPPKCVKAHIEKGLQRDLLTGLHYSAEPDGGSLQCGVGWAAYYGPQAAQLTFTLLGEEGALPVHKKVPQTS